MNCLTTNQKEVNKMNRRERIRTIISGETADRCGFWLGNPHGETWPILHNYFGASTPEELQRKLLLSLPLELILIIQKIHLKELPLLLILKTIIHHVQKYFNRDYYFQDLIMNQILYLVAQLDFLIIIIIILQVLMMEHMNFLYSKVK